MSESRSIRALLADDHNLVRRGIAEILAEERDIEVVGEASDGKEAIDRAVELMPDIILMDISMPGLGGLEATRRIKEILPHVRIVMLTVSEENEDLVQAIRYGAQGYLLKKIEPKALADCVRGVMRAETPISPTMAGRLLAEVARGDQPTADPSLPKTILSSHEMEVITLISRGKSNRQIGAELDITEDTVKNRLKSILKKLHLENRVQAAVYAVHHGLHSPLPE